MPLLTANAACRGDGETGWLTTWGRPTVQTGTVTVILLHFSKQIMLCTKFLPPRLFFLPLASDTVMTLRRGAQPLPVCLTTEIAQLLKAQWDSGSTLHYVRNASLKFAQWLIVQKWVWDIAMASGRALGQEE